MDGAPEGHDTRTMASTEGRTPAHHEHPGDCPACACGRIQWQRCCGPGDALVLYAGACKHCGQWAGQCPVCGDRVQLDESVVECPCETCFALVPHMRGTPLIEIVTADEVRRTYAVPEK
jgi:hypothetical protein